MIDYRHGLSILQVVVYIPTLFIALWVAFHNGFKKSSGWCYFVVFSLARVIGSCCYLATLSNPTSKDLFIAWAACQSLGISPLTMALFGLLSLVNDSIKSKRGRSLSPIFFRLLGILTIVAAILCVMGQTKNTSLTQTSVNSKTKIGQILFVLAWVSLSIVALYMLKHSHDIEPGEHRLLSAVGASIPLLFLRILYSLISTFSHDQRFNMLTGNETVQLCMAILEKIAIVIACLGTGLTLIKRQRASDVEFSRIQNPNSFSARSG
ncbi:unnamed protein product [Penicillium salamii]|nr:unnamed protein product [Penicillium salamii]